MGEVERLRAELEALHPYVEERDRLMVERDRLEEQLRGVDERNALVTYQRDRLQWKLDALKARRSMRILQVLFDAMSNPRRLVRLPLDLFRVLTTSVRRPPEPEMPEVVARRSIADSAVAETRSGVELRTRFLTPPAPDGLRDLRVAGILDTFSASCFAPDCALVQFRPDNWREALEQHGPHLLLVESAWQGNGGSWQYQVGSYSYAESVGLPHLRAVVEWCRERDVPTVFWNKEDPVHFDKFKEAARLFDVVLTTDADRVAAYRGLDGLRAHTVDALPFAAQPALHNPMLAPSEREPVPVFAGTYYRNRHEERRAQLEMLLDAAAPFGLRIFDRMHGSESESVGYPDRFHEHIEGGLPYDEMVRAYKQFRVFLNTNSVTASPTMFSRRVFELLASGTPVVSTPSLGMEQMLGDVLDVVSDEGAARAAIEALLHDDAHWAARSRAGVRAVMGSHTYAHRLATIAGHCGLDLDVPGPRVAVLALDDGQHSLAAVRAAADAGAVDEVLLGATGEGTLLTHPRATVVDQDTDTTTEARFRELAERAGTDWVAIVGHTSHTGLVEDLVATLAYTDADLVGTATGDHERYVAAVAAAPVLIRRELVASHGWTLDQERSDELQAELLAAGRRAYAADVPDHSV